MSMIVWVSLSGFVRRSKAQRAAQKCLLPSGALRSLSAFASAVGCGGIDKHDDDARVLRTIALGVVSVVDDGAEDVYDVAVAAPLHNFVANGIVVHVSLCACEIACALTWHVCACVELLRGGDVAREVSRNDSIPRVR
jgi:hypothetical protein